MKKGRTRITYGHVPVVLSELAHEAVETKLEEKGFVTNAEEAVAEDDPVPDRIEDLPEGGYFIAFGPRAPEGTDGTSATRGNEWMREYKRWVRHFDRTDPRNLAFLGVMFDSIINVLVIYDCRNHTGGIRVT